MNLSSLVSIDLWHIIMTVMIAHLLALLSPGPDFLLIVRSSLKNTRKNAIGVVLGICVANAIYIILCMLGVGSIIAYSVWLMYTIKIVGGCFLIYIAFQALTAKKSDYLYNLDESSSNLGNAPHQNSFLTEFTLGLISGLSNPKNILFYLSLFSMVLTPNVSPSIVIGLSIWMVSLIFIWDAMIVIGLSKPKISRIFNKFAFYFDKLAGLFLGVLGYNVLESVVKNKI